MRYTTRRLPLSWSAIEFAVAKVPPRLTEIESSFDRRADRQDDITLAKTAVITVQVWSSQFYHGYGTHRRCAIIRGTYDAYLRDRVLAMFGTRYLDGERNGGIGLLEHSCHPAPQLLGNGQDGIWAGCVATIINNTILSNERNGIYAGGISTLIGNTSEGNGYYGLSISTGQCSGNSLLNNGNGDFNGDSSPIID